MFTTVYYADYYMLRFYDAFYLFHHHERLDRFAYALYLSAVYQ